MMSADLADRIDRRLKKVGMSARAASLEAGLSDAFVRNILKGKSQSPRAENFEALARVLRTTSTWLLKGEGPEEPDVLREPLPSGDSTIEDLPSRGSFRFAKVDGPVQAGAFLALEAFDDDLGEVVSAPRDPVFPFARQRAYRVKGDSMNQALPSPMNDGDIIICAVWEDLGLEPRDGLNVVVQQTTADGQLRERSVKELKVFPDRAEFHPRSTNKAHKPIVMRRDHHTDDGKEVTILALVRFVFNNQALPV
jgi:transcriptional regulator with XRE-family HTH domain